MLENSSAGLVMLDPGVAVTVTREEHHQRALSRYPITSDVPRRVAVELRWCTIQAGKHQGHRAIEVHLDGHRVGELTYAMSQRYAPAVNAVTARGGRPGCQADLFLGKRGIELTLRLPRQSDMAATRVAPSWPTSAPPPRPPSPPVPSPRKPSNKLPAWIATGVVGVVIFAAAISGGDDTPSDSLAASSTTTTTRTTTTTTTTTTTVPPAPTTEPAAVPAPAPAPAPTTKPRPTTTTKRTTTPPPPPAPKPTTAKPAPACHPNYTPCVPIASDVDCAGGSGNGPAYVTGPIRILGADPYRLDADNDGIGCE
ncbi:hypothetical protein [Actinokineospora sp. HUAS TT18]|uniref:hypothetical protein n=1 Tax=Actinokineospora sp. HUAS TT18 TaxID=3447451 RepID=UPI003F525518